MLHFLEADQKVTLSWGTKSILNIHLNNSTINILIKI